MLLVARCILCNDWLPGPAHVPSDYHYQLEERKKVKVFGDNTDREDPGAQLFRAVHEDCRRTFTRYRQISSEQAWSELWESFPWTEPWNGCPSLELDHGNKILFVDHFAAAIGLPQLSQLSAELTKMIQDFSAGSLIWRLTRVMMLAMEGPLSGKEQSCLLSKVSAWERGGEPVIAADDNEPALPQIIRLTMDSRGLREIERLQEKPVYRYGRSESKAFAVFNEMDSGFARLTSGKCKSTSKIPIWDTPTPPTQIKLPPHTEQCWTVELDNATGITFFVSIRGIEGAQAHTGGSFPCASTLNPSLDHNLWIYIPTPPGDKITACRMVFDSDNCVFLYRKQLSGTSGVGYNPGYWRLQQSYGVEQNNIMPTALVLRGREDR
ncbi:hypothetical protein B0T21DRAFT_406722 [Apiosordaria backusii]|uniref:Uncharacterized protein n=1 Tax=Apiosordaria backusii TaxID=314023 RepID=A0AA40K6X7_9PEZI|nr:hypothetical protein B0T21DRAFT_406722 [Apiosordaria backusii]